MNNKQLYIGAAVVKESGIPDVLEVTELLGNNRIKWASLDGAQSGEAYSSDLRFATDEEIKAAS